MMSTTPSARSNRHSLNTYPTSGPRPLQLVNGITSPTKPTSAVTATTPTSTRSHVHDDRHGVSATHSSQSTLRTSQTPSNANLRRHSSISYKNSSYDHYITTTPENDVPSTKFRTKPRPRSLMFLVHPSHPGHPNTLVTASSPLARDSNDSKEWSFDPGLNVNGAGGTGTSTPAEERKRRPLTLVEKHADLLRFIAQKESKCLELRSQLVIHEAELVQLKRKWERIVSRSFESPLSPPGSASPSSALPSVSTSPSRTINIPTKPIPVFEGIKESVQGVSRLIASGLSASGDHHYYNCNLPSPLSLHYQSRPSTTQPRPKPKPRPHSLYSQYPSNTTSSHIRSPNLSASSNATSSTSTPSSADSVTTPTTASVGTRFSAASFDSSSSSFFEVDDQNATSPPTKISETSSSPTTRGAEVAEDPELSANSSIDSWSSSELIVRDTGATPMMSPNPKFKFAAERRQRESEKSGFSKTNDKKMSVDLETDKNEESIVTIESVVSPEMGNSSAISRSNSDSRCHRRKSRDVSGLLPLSSSALDDCPASPHLDLHSNTTLPSQQTRSRSTLSPSLISLPSPGSTTTKSQRNSLVGTFAPVSTIPGLSLAESPAMLVTGACGSSGEISSPSHPVRMEMENEARASTCQHLQVQQTQHTEQHSPSSWMGKKWDKWTQKRTSGLLSDVSQTLACAFSLSTTSSTTQPTPRSTLSILDQDDDFIPSTTMDEPMKPTTVVVCPRTADIDDISCQGQGRKLRSKVQSEDESEWNW